MFMSRSSLIRAHLYLDHEYLGGCSTISKILVSGLKTQVGVQVKILDVIVNLLNIYVSTFTSENIHIWNICTWECLLQVCKYWSLGSSHRVAGAGLEKSTRALVLTSASDCRTSKLFIFDNVYNYQIHYSI